LISICFFWSFCYVLFDLYLFFGSSSHHPKHAASLWMFDVTRELTDQVQPKHHIAMSHG
jgi:hypothetical protein